MATRNPTSLVVFLLMVALVTGCGLSAETVEFDPGTTVRHRVNVLGESTLEFFPVTGKSYTLTTIVTLRLKPIDVEYVLPEGPLHVEEMFPMRLSWAMTSEKSPLPNTLEYVGVEDGTHAVFELNPREVTLPAELFPNAKPDPSVSATDSFRGALKWTMRLAVPLPGVQVGDVRAAVAIHGWASGPDQWFDESALVLWWLYFSSVPE